MMMKRTLFLLVAFLAVFAATCLASEFPEGSKLDKYYKLLSAYDFVPYNQGYTLEELVKIDLKEKYPPQKFEITGGLEMANAAGFAIGEIDVLVLDRQTKKVVLIGEAKVWADLAKGLVKAKAQLAKLKEAIHSGEIKSLYFVPDPSRKLELDIFEGTQISYETFGSKGAKGYGFDHELDITPAETTALNKALIKAHYKDYKPSGEILEYIEYVKKLKFPTRDEKSTFIACVRLENEKIYTPDKYKVLDDVAYFDAAGNDLGHVKMVFADRKDNKVANVLNIVYGWNNLNNAAKVYNKYLADFNAALKNGVIVNLKAKFPKDATLSPEHFGGVFNIDSYGIKGSKAQGFTKELSLTDDDVFFIRLKALGDL